MKPRGSWSVRAPFVVIIVAVGALAWGVTALFQQRFARGDVYPAYSSLRTDPLGTSVLAAGLQHAGLTVARHYRRLDRGTRDVATWYLAGLDATTLATQTDRGWQALLDATDAGGRLVLAFAPADRGSWSRALREARRERRERERGQQKQENDDEAEEGDEADQDEVAPARRGTPLLQHLGLEPAKLTRESGGAMVAVRDPAADTRLPTELGWHASVTFEPKDPAWATVYAVEDQPVALVRAWGQGTIVVVGDSYHLSNEAMLRDRATPWLVWLQGARDRAVFDESHLGVTEQHGVMSLARRYGLLHAVAVLAAIALLFIWRNNSSLIPAAAPDRVTPRDEVDEASGREAATGFVNLLRRTITPAQVFGASLAEFRRSVAWRRLGPEAQQALEELNAGLPAKPDPVATTRAAHALLARKP